MAGRRAGLACGRHAVSCSAACCGVVYQPCRNDDHMSGSLDLQDRNLTGSWSCCRSDTRSPLRRFPAKGARSGTVGAGLQEAEIHLYNRSGGPMKVSIVFVVAASLLLPVTAFSQDPMTGEKVYQKSCAACHGSGVAGAPKLGDKAAWAPRIGEGMDVMYKSALQGDGAVGRHRRHLRAAARRAPGVFVPARPVQHALPVRRGRGGHLHQR